MTITEANYCQSGPAATIAWSYSDPTGKAQSAYQVQVDDNGSFSKPIIDTGKINSGSNAYNTGTGILQFNTTYRARIRVWNTNDLVSGWTTSNSWKTPNSAYPQVNFTWPPASVIVGGVVQFTDQTVFSDGNGNGRRWSWLFGDSGTSTSQNPQHTYNTSGTYDVTLTATDNNNDSCNIVKPLTVKKQVPLWKEVAPK